MRTTGTPQVLPTLRNTCGGLSMKVDSSQLPVPSHWLLVTGYWKLETGNWKLLRRDDASSQRDFEAELMRALVAWGHRHAGEMKRVGASDIHAAEARAATAEPGVAHQRTVRIFQVVAAAVGVREQVNRCAELPLDFAARAEDLLRGPIAVPQPEVGVRPRVRADVEPALVQ